MLYCYQSLLLFFLQTTPVLLKSPFLQGENEVPGNVVSIASRRDIRLSQSFQPWILSVKGLNFTAFVNETVLTPVVISDLSGTAHVSCSTICSAPNVSKLCPRFYAKTSDRNLFVGFILFNGSPPTNQLVKLHFPLSCVDLNKPSPTSTAWFSVALVNNETLAFHLPNVTKQLIHLSTQSVGQKTPSELLMMVNSITNEMKMFTDNLNEVDVAVASAVIAEIVDAINEQQQMLNNDTLPEQITQAISTILGSNPQARRGSETAAGVVSQLLRVTSKLIASIEIDSLRPNRTYVSENLAISAVEVDRKMGRDTWISFGGFGGFWYPQCGSLDSARVSISKTASFDSSISVRVGQIISGRVDFVVFSCNVMSALHSNEGLVMVSPIVSVLGKVRGSVSFTMTLIIDYNPFHFCASWNAHSRAWSRQGCLTKRTYGFGTSQIVCLCSESTNIVIFLDNEALNELSLVTILSCSLLSVTFILLAFTLFVHCHYARRKWISSRRAPLANVVLATERSWIIIIMCSILLMINFNLEMRIVPLMEIICSGRNVFHLVLILLFAIFSVLEGWQAFITIVSRISVNNFSTTTSIGSVYGCFNKNWCLTVFLLTLFILFSICFSTVSIGVADLNVIPFCNRKFAVYLGFALPLTLCFVVDMILSGLLAYALIWRSANLDPKHKSRSRNKAIGYFAVSLIFYITSMAGILSKDEDLWMFCAFLFLSVILGVVYFVSYCLMREEIRREICKACSCCCFWRTEPDEQEIDENVEEYQPLMRQINS